MKSRLTAIIITIVLTLCNICIAESIDVSQLVGDWSLSSVDGQQLSETGADFTLAEDGTAVLSWNGSTMEATWSIQDSKLVFQNSDGPLMLLDITDNATITAQIEGTVYTFGKSTMTFAVDSVDNAINVTARDFMGTWSAKSIIVYGSEYSAADFGIILQMAIGDGECTLITDADELTYEAQFSDGILSVGSDEDLICCRMRQDGTLAFELEEADISMTVIMERTA